MGGIDVSETWIAQSTGAAELRLEVGRESEPTRKQFTMGCDQGIEPVDDESKSQTHSDNDFGRPRGSHVDGSCPIGCRTRSK